ncbi:MAG: energy-coupling factor transporter transmembrane protein EcfT, partial [Solobacterium sp.]|nr:energy-coupling factor transporter transmembrane protein EcfT [Solobacterium sp.]
MGNFTLGRYLPLDSPIHKMDPRAKIIAMLVMLIAVFIPAGWIGYGVIFVVAAS